LLSTKPGKEAGREGRREREVSCDLALLSTEPNEGEREGGREGWRESGRKA
jgi:hypothetical protein